MCVPPDAAKDFYDSKNSRRILWGWAQIPGGAQALPRQIAWQAELGQLLFMPLREQEQLRQLPPIVDRTALKLRPGAPQSIGASWPAGAAKHSEVVATFAMPKAATVFGIGIAVVDSKPAKEAFVEFKPRTGPSPDGPWWEVRVGVGPPAQDSEAGGGGVEAAEQSLRLLPSDMEIELRVFVDGAMCEVFFMGGRVALTLPITLGAEQAGFTAFSDKAAAVNVEAHRVGSIWVTPEQVLGTPV